MAITASVGGRGLLEAEQAAGARQEVGDERGNCEPGPGGCGGAGGAEREPEHQRLGDHDRRDGVERERAADGESEHGVGRDAAVAAAEVQVEVHPSAHEDRNRARDGCDDRAT